MTGVRSRILIVDDDPMAVQLLEELLGDEYQLSVATTGVEALAKAQSTLPDLVLLDVVMADVDGYETCRQIRACGTLADVKVLLVSGMSRAEERVRGYQAGADDFLTKPFDGAELVAKVRVYLRLKKAEEMDRLKSTFLANMSHEIRTPLHAVSGLTELVLETELTPPQRDMLTTVGRSARSLLGIIDEILDWSKIEAGRLQLEEVPIDPREVLSDALQPLAAVATEKRLELVLDVAPQVPERILGDALRLRQIVTNLVGNAIKFTAAGEVVVTATATASSSGQCELCISVRDTGIGIAPAAQARLFESFYQADMSTTRRFGGTGLGLAISRRIAAAMGGNLSLASAPGTGSTFCVRWPARVDSPAPPPPAVRGRVLMLDDHPTAGPAGLRAWAALGLPGELATDTATALALLGAAGTGEWLVCFADGRPTLDLATTVARIRAQHPSTRFVVSTARRVHVGELADAQGMPSLQRPLLPRDLAPALAAALAERAETSTPRRSPAWSGRSLRVLVAEDNAVNQRLVSDLLERDGHTWVAARDGEECLRRLAAERFDVVLMDMQMPECDGVQATRRIRAGEVADMARVPIVGLTANAFAEDREKCLAAGMDAFLSKPFRVDELRAVIQRLTPNGGVSEL
jgi:two-component system, sensor histidine kinase and response regulator